MSEFLKIESIAQINQLFGNQTIYHPFVSIIDFTSIKSMNLNGKIYSGLYAIMLKQQCAGTLQYGRQKYDFQSGSLVFVAPCQVISIEEEITPSNNRDWGLFFHPDLLTRTTLNAKIKDYSFFNYSVNEALHLSLKEKNILNEIIEKIERELVTNIDKHSRTLIASNIELLLNYCVRYFDRQFITRSNKNKDTLSKLEDLLSEYFNIGEAEKNGLPSVKYLSEQLHLSPNYLSDLLKKETGKSALDHIHRKIVEIAKRKLLVPDNSIAHGLGFEYPQYFTRVFKKRTGTTPLEYRKMN